MQPASCSNTGDHVAPLTSVNVDQRFVVKPLDWRTVVSHSGTAYKAQTPFGCYVIEFCNCSRGGHWQWMSHFGGQMSHPQAIDPTNDPGVGLGCAMDSVFKHWVTCMLDVLSPVQNPLPVNTKPSLN